jgi:hypothetical protein
LPVLAANARIQLAQIALARRDRAPFDALVADGSETYALALVATCQAILEGDLASAFRLLPARDDPDRRIDHPSLLAIEMRLRVARGEEVQARKVFEEWEAMTQPARLTGPADLVIALVEAGEGLLTLGDDLKLQKAYEVLAERPGFRFTGVAVDGADAVRGALALRLGHVDAADEHYRLGLDWARRPDVRFGLVEGRCLQGLAAVAEARGDHALAMEHLDAAGEKFAEYGAKLYLDQVLAKKQFLNA